MIDQIALRLLLVIVFAVTTQVSEQDLIDEEFELSEEMFYVERKDEEDKENESLTKSENIMTVSSDQEKIKSTGEVEEEQDYQKIKKWLEQFPEIEGKSQAREFIQTISPLAVLIAEENGIYPSVMIAQAGLESAWGTSGLARDYNNLMGTKGSWEGESVTMATGEEVAGEKVKIKTGFSVYNSWADSLNRYGQLMRNGLDWDQDYYQGTWRENAADYTKATEWLVGRYATDSSYAEKLNATIQAYDLTEFDEIEALDLDYGEYVTETSLEI